MVAEYCLSHCNSRFPHDTFASAYHIRCRPTIDLSFFLSETGQVQALSLALQFPIFVAGHLPQYLLSTSRQPFKLSRSDIFLIKHACVQVAKKKSKLTALSEKTITFQNLVCNRPLFYNTGKDCGTWENNTLKSPNYPRNYTHNNDCVYRILVPNGVVINISFSDFQLGEHLNLDCK